MWLLWLCLGGVVILLLSWYGSSLITQIAPYPEPCHPRDFGFVCQPARFRNADGLTLAGWFLPAKTASDATLVVLHGVGANKSDVLPQTRFLVEKGGWNLFYFDFRGHGESEGKHTSLGPLEVRDLEAALRFLHAEKTAQAGRIALFGFSLGASVALVGAASHLEVQAVVAESPFADVEETIARFGKMFYGFPRFPFIWLATQFASWRMGVRIRDFRPLKAVPRIAPRPLLIIQGERDGRVPPEEGRRLYAAAREPKTLWEVRGADHGEPWMLAREEYERRVLGFFNAAFSPVQSR